MTKARRPMFLPGAQGITALPWVFGPPREGSYSASDSSSGAVYGPLCLAGLNIRARSALGAVGAHVTTCFPVRQPKGDSVGAADRRGPRPVDRRPAIQREVSDHQCSGRFRRKTFTKKFGVSRGVYAARRVARDERQVVSPRELRVPVEGETPVARKPEQRSQARFGVGSTDHLGAPQPGSGGTLQDSSPSLLNGRLLRHLPIMTPGDQDRGRARRACGAAFSVSGMKRCLRVVRRVVASSPGHLGFPARQGQEAFAAVLLHADPKGVLFMPARAWKSLSVAPGTRVVTLTACSL